MRTRILLAGERAFAVSSTPSLLSLYSPEYLTAQDGKEAFVLMVRYRPRLAVVASDLRGLPALDLMTLVRADRELRSTSLILLGDGLADRGARRFANATFDCTGGIPWEAFLDRADRLLSIPPRVSARASVCLGRRLSEGTSGSFAQTVNISEAGMLLESREPLGLGESVWLHFVLPRMMELVAAQGRVVRQASAFHLAPAGRVQGYGLEFTRLLPEDQLRIRRYVRQELAA